MSQSPEKNQEVHLDTVVNQAVDSISEKLTKLKTLNIIVSGKTGVGKSTLINSVFGFDEAETGSGMPITKHVRAHSKESVPLVIYDTPGFELKEEVQKQVESEINDLIMSGVRSKDINKTIHCALYCISAASRRVEPAEIEWLKKLTNAGGVTKVPVIVVFTQCYIEDSAVDELRKVVEEANLPIVDIVEVLAKDVQMTSRRSKKIEIPSFGLDDLIRLMGRTLPEEIRDTFWSVQQAYLAEKQKKAHAVVAATAASAVAVGAVPIPFSDSVFLIPAQATMLGAITVIFGLKVSRGFLAEIISGTIGGSGAAILGPVVVSTILKFIPGAGLVVGGAISGATAGIITAALGEAYIGIMTKLFKGEINMDDFTSEKGKAMISALFKEELGKSREDK